MRMWEIRENDSYRHGEYPHREVEYGMGGFKDHSYHEGYECGYEDGYKAAKKELSDSYSERRMMK